MGFTLQDLATKDVKKLEYKFQDGDVFAYSVSINRINFSMMARVQEAAQKLAEMTETNEVTEEQEEGVVVLMELLVGWDLVDGDGKEAPINRENVLKIPLPMLVTMLENVMAQISPNPESATS